MKYHPEYSWLEQYAAGTLSVPVALCVATHLAFCSECRRQIAVMQGLGGVLVEQLAPVPVSEQLLEKILLRIDNAPAPVAAVVDGGSIDRIPQPLRKLVPNGYDRLVWSRILPVLQEARLAEEEGYRVALHRIKAGGKVPRHDHRGEEFTVVVRGSFSDESGVYVGGDFLLREAGQVHRPLAAQNEECICLTVQQGPVRFTGLLWRCLNPLLR